MKQLTLVLNPATDGSSPLGDGSCVCTEVIIHLHNPTLTEDNEGLIIGTLSDSIQMANGQYRFIVDYNEELLDNPDSSLGQCDIKSICCKDCTTEYIDKRLRQVAETNFEVEADFGDNIQVSSGSVLSVVGDGGAQVFNEAPATVKIKVLPTATESDNILTYGLDGRFYVPKAVLTFGADSGTPTNVNSGQTLNIVGAGGADTAVTPGVVTVDVSPSVDPGNALSYGTDGKLYVAATESGAFIVDADSGSPQTISPGNTLNILGTGGAETSVGATDTVTIDVSPSTDLGNALGYGADGKLYVAASESGSFLVAADTGSNQTISPGDTLTLVGDDGIETEATGTDEITIRWNPSVAGAFGANYAVTGLSVANGIITLNSAREHTSALFSGSSINATVVDISALGTFDTAGYTFNVTNPSAYRSMKILLNITASFVVNLRNAGSFILSLRINGSGQEPSIYWNSNGASASPPTAGTHVGTILVPISYTLTLAPGATTALSLVQRIVTDDASVAGSSVTTRAISVDGIGFTV